jgi:2-polyprenyl-3-methyl-5-hydroxy-6-metoxy-1,4-benzoquinol methylase
MKHGKTAVYTILKNEKKYIEKWLYYAAPFDYRVLLDTGSTDGSWELLQEYAKKDPNLIIEQKTFTPWRFDTARKYNLAMVPDDVVWCLSPDLDEYFSINTHDEMEKIISAVPNITNIACDRLDVYSRTVRVGPPNHIPTNKIHLKKDYTWNQPIYEHLTWIHKDRYEKELYSDDIFLIHDQDFQKKERPKLYVKMMEEEYRDNPTNTWNLWYLTYHYEKSRQLEKYVNSACDFVKYEKNIDSDWFKHIYTCLSNIQTHTDTPLVLKDQIASVLKNISIKTYFKEVFNPHSIEHAKEICLTSDLIDDNKFENETKYLIDFLKGQDLIKSTTKVVDFGCGVGRISKALIRDIGCEVVGFDISENMLKYATEYVNDDKFIPVIYDKNMTTIGKPKFDLTIASLVLQHSEHPIHDIKVIKDVLNTSGTLVLINEPNRYVPIGVNSDGYVVWEDDKIDILQEVSKHFKLVGKYPYYNRDDYPLTVWRKE